MLVMSAMAATAVVNAEFIPVTNELKVEYTPGSMTTECSVESILIKNVLFVLLMLYQFLRIANCKSVRLIFSSPCA